MMMSLTSFLLFHFNFELLGFFIVMINVMKIELNSATEYYLLNIFFVRNFFYQLNYSLSIALSFSQDQGV